MVGAVIPVGVAIRVSLAEAHDEEVEWRSLLRHRRVGEGHLNPKAATWQRQIFGAPTAQMGADWTAESDSTAKSRESRTLKALSFEGP